MGSIKATIKKVTKQNAKREKQLRAMWAMETEDDTLLRQLTRNEGEGEDEWRLYQARMKRAVITSIMKRKKRQRDTYQEQQMREQMKRAQTIEALHIIMSDTITPQIKQRCHVTKQPANIAKTENTNKNTNKNKKKTKTKNTSEVCPHFITLRILEFLNEQFLQDELVHEIFHYVQIFQCER